MANYKTLIKAIRNGSLNCEKHSTGSEFMWHGRELVIMPVFCSYGKIGYSIQDTKLKGRLEYDYEMNKFEIVD